MFPESRILLCWWHITRAWRENINKAYKDKAKMIGRKLNQNEKRLLEDELFTDLKNLMHINDISIVNEILTAFLEKWKNFETFINYFKF